MVAKVSDMASYPGWPRGMSPEQAAAYLGMTPETMRKYIPVEPTKYGSRVLYDRAALDKYLDKRNAGEITGNWVEDKFSGGDQDQRDKAG